MLTSLHVSNEVTWYHSPRKKQAGTCTAEGNWAREGKHKRCCFPSARSRSALAPNCPFLPPDPNTFPRGGCGKIYNRGNASSCGSASSRSLLSSPPSLPGSAGLRDTRHNSAPSPSVDPLHYDVVAQWGDNGPDYAPLKNIVEQGGRETVPGKLGRENGGRGEGDEGEGGREYTVRITLFLILRKSLWLQAREALWPNCKRMQSRESRFFV